MLQLNKLQRYRFMALCCFLLLITNVTTAQRILDSTGKTIVVDSIKSLPVDSLKKVATTTIDKKKVDSVQKAHSPRKAIIRSAIIPGWGQVYNKKIWKVPIVYAALGVTTYVFLDNIQVYKDSRFAYKAKFKASAQGGGDSTDYWLIKPEYLQYSLEGLRTNRNQFRQYIDYSVLFFVFFWGLNVVDAAVDGHLKAFDVSPDLSLKLKGGYSEMAGTKGLSLILAFK